MRKDWPPSSAEERRELEARGVKFDREITEEIIDWRAVLPDGREVRAASALAGDVRLLEAAARRAVLKRCTEELGG